LGQSGPLVYKAEPEHRGQVDQLERLGILDRKGKLDLPGKMAPLDRREI
jgi:hypothetical protein